MHHCIFIIVWMRYSLFYFYISFCYSVVVCSKDHMKGNTKFTIWSQWAAVNIAVLDNILPVQTWISSDLPGSITCKDTTHGYLFSVTLNPPIILLVACWGEVMAGWLCHTEGQTNKNHKSIFFMEFWKKKIRHIWNNIYYTNEIKGLEKSKLLRYFNIFL